MYFYYIIKVKNVCLERAEYGIGDLFEMTSLHSLYLPLQNERRAPVRENERERRGNRNN